MKIMYICGMYCPSHGGAEISMFSLLKRLRDDLGWEVLALTDLRYESTKRIKKFNKVKIETINHTTRFKEIEKHILNFNPDAILTQLMWSDVALKLAKKHKIPSILRVCKIPLKLNLSVDSEYSPTALIATSKIVKDYIKKNWDREAQVIMPLIEIKEYLILDKQFNSFDNRYIFMFNPLKRKGGVLFKRIAKRLPNKKFGTVFGWSSLKNIPSSNKFSRKYIKRITESEGSPFEGSLPSYVNFSNCPNIKIFNPEDDVRIIYKKIKILLIPSQWEEAFGRVAVEGMINGIPILGSKIGGLKESIGHGGILLDKEITDVWIEEILKFDNLDYYKKMSSKARGWVRRHYSERKIIRASANLIEKVVNRTPRIEK